MIRYQLICDKGHVFDGWFSGAAGFDRQKAAGQLECPGCGSTGVDKALMAPAVPAKGKPKGEAKAPRPDKGQPVFHADPKQAEIKAALRKLREHVVSNADYVGDRFAEEARKIHYNESESRGIYGEASAEDARALRDEGIEFHPLPVLPEDHN
jgi:hypothetical protein